MFLLIKKDVFIPLSLLQQEFGLSTCSAGCDLLLDYMVCWSDWLKLAPDRQ